MGKEKLTKEPEIVAAIVQLVFPMDEAEIGTTTPVIEWEAYPEAAYYEVALRYDTLGEHLPSDDQSRTEEPRLDVSATLPEPLQPGIYDWGSMPTTPTTPG